MADEKKAKAKRPTAQKRDIQNEKRRLQNRAFKSRVKTAVRSFQKEAAEKSSDETKKSLDSLYSLLDKGVKRGVFKLNKASRLKSQFTKKA